jgi:hypothetical protein
MYPTAASSITITRGYAVSRLVLNDNASYWSPLTCTSTASSKQLICCSARITCTIFSATISQFSFVGQTISRFDRSTTFAHRAWPFDPTAREQRQWVGLGWLKLSLPNKTPSDRVNVGQ